MLPGSCPGGIGLSTALAGTAIKGPWDATAVSHGQAADLFVTNAFRGTAAGQGKTVRGGALSQPLGLTLAPSGTVYYTDDAANTLRLLH